MNVRAWSPGVWAVPITGVGVVVWATLAPVAPPIVAPPPGRAAETRALRPYPADSLAHVVIGGDVFRIRRTPAATGYDALRGAVPSEAPPAAKPVLALAGIVGGTEPAAVIEGLPGTDGPRVLRRGETVGALRVRDILRDRVIVVGLDTTWTLKVKTPWN